MLVRDRSIICLGRSGGGGGEGTGRPRGLADGPCHCVRMGSRSGRPTAPPRPPPPDPDVRREVVTKALRRARGCGAVRRCATSREPNRTAELVGSTRHRLTPRTRHPTRHPRPPARPVGSPLGCPCGKNIKYFQVKLCSYSTNTPADTQYMNSQLWRRSVYTIRLRTFSGSTTDTLSGAARRGFRPGTRLQHTKPAWTRITR